VEQQILKKDYTQRALDRIKDDTSSLVVLYDSHSFVTKTTKDTRTTASASNYSKEFDFDSELLQYKPYKRGFRALLRRSKIVPQPQSRPSTTQDANATTSDHSRLVSLTQGFTTVQFNRSSPLFPPLPDTPPHKAVSLVLIGCKMATLMLLYKTREQNAPPTNGSLEEYLMLRTMIRRRFILDTISLLKERDVEAVVVQKELDALSTVGLLDPNAPLVLHALESIYDLQPEVGLSLDQLETEPIWR
jgi:hypothetical protein